jgi:hypothetical protein
LSKEFLTQRLHEFAKEKGIILLHAAESGSRGWGFSSPDSDYDVRFIYMWPKEKYLGLYSNADTLQLEDAELDLDFEGWSLSKVLLSLQKGNIVTLEWIQSPVIYHDLEGFGAMLFSMFGGSENFRAGACIGHYMGMAAKARAEGAVHVYGPPQMKVKKLFYALRAYMATTFVIFNETMPPMTWSALLEANKEFADHLSPSLKLLMDQKTTNGEKHVVSVPPDVSAFMMLVEDKIKEWMKTHSKGEVPPNEKFDSLFRYMVNKYGNP